MPWIISPHSHSCGVRVSVELISDALDHLSSHSHLGFPHPATTLETSPSVIHLPLPSNILSTWQIGSSCSRPTFHCKSSVVGFICLCQYSLNILKHGEIYTHDL